MDAVSTYTTSRVRRASLMKLLLLVLVVSSSLMMMQNKLYVYIPPPDISSSTVSLSEPSSSNVQVKMHEFTQSLGDTDSDVQDPPAIVLDKYYWLGNHWIPPQGVPTYTPLDFLKYFQKRNVLFIGDSTGRRSYATLYAIMQSALDSTADENAIMNTKDTSKNRRDDRTVNLRVAELDAASVIDVNRGHNRRESCQLTDRRLYNATEDFLCRQLDYVKQHAKEDRRNATNDFVPSLPSAGKFDYVVGTCMYGILDFLTNPNATATNTNDTTVSTSSSTTDNQHADDKPQNKQLITPSYLQDYDLVVVASGVWDTVQNHICKKIEYGDGVYPPDHPEERVADLLEALKSLSSPRLQIAFRTVGFKGDHQHDDKHWNMIHTTQDFFEKLEIEKKEADDTIEAIKNKNNHPNMTLVDWGSLMSDRSWQKDRIHGDIPVHYGLEARLLFAQQLLHQLLKAEQQT